MNTSIHNQIENITYKIYYTWKMSIVSFLSVAFGLLVALMVKNNAWSWLNDFFMGDCGIFFLIGLFPICLKSRKKFMKFLSIVLENIKSYINNFR